VDCSKTQHELQRLYNLYGGVPRYVFRRNRPDYELESALQNINVPTLRQVLSSTLYNTMPLVGKLACLITIEPSSTTQLSDARVGLVRIASDEILVKLRDALEFQLSSNQIGFFEAVRGIPSFGAWSGYFLEDYVHKKLLIPQTLTLLDLQSNHSRRIE